MKIATEMPVAFTALTIHNEGHRLSPDPHVCTCCFQRFRPGDRMAYVVVNDDGGRLDCQFAHVVCPGAPVASQPGKEE